MDNAERERILRENIRRRKPPEHLWQVVAPDDPIAEAAWWQPVHQEIQKLRLIALFIGILAVPLSVAVYFFVYPLYAVACVGGAVWAASLFLREADRLTRDARRARLRMSISARERARLNAEEAAEAEERGRAAEQRAAERARREARNQPLPEREPARLGAM